VDSPDPKRSDSSLLTGRAGKIWQEHMRGATQRELATKYGVCHQRISQIIDTVRKEVTAESIEEVNQRTLGLLRELTGVHMRIVDGGPQPKVTQSGKIVTDPATGEPIPDWSQVMQAAAGVIRITERAAKILGSDAAARQDLSVTVDPGEIEIVRRIKAWKAAQEGAAAPE
jgi:hypothetical protein